MRVLPSEVVSELLSLPDLLPVVESAFIKQSRNEVTRPDRPHFPIGEGLGGVEGPKGIGLTMPAYVHGDPAFATKLVTVHEDNPTRGLPTVQAQLVLSDAATGEPLAFMSAEDITNARTGCIGGLAARELASDAPVSGEGTTLGVIGAGAQARWQTRAIGATRDLGRVRVYSPHTRAECAADLRGEGFDAVAVDGPRAAVEEADIVVTATTSHEPVFPGDALRPGALVIAVGAYTREMRELDGTSFERAGRVFADVPEEVAEIGDLVGNGVDRDRLVPFSEVLKGEAGRGTPDEVIIVESVGSAVLDAATANHLYERADTAGIGRTVDL